MVRPLLLTGIALMLVLAGCSSGGESTTQVESTNDPPPPSTAAATGAADPGRRPKVGECHDLSWRQAVSPEAQVDPVRCGTPHTAQTYAVGRLDLDGETLAVDSPRAQERVQRTCAERLPRHLGATPRQLRLTMAQPVWFTPTAEQVDAGARWLRCDVVVIAAAGELLRLPARTQGSGNSPVIAMCATAEPGTSGFARVVCGRKHSWVAVATVDLVGARLPSARQVESAMDPVCREAARSRAGDPLDFTWSQESPTREQWAAGQRYGICWTPS